MSPKGWRKNTSITRKLVEAPYRFNFLQAVRLLERSAVFEKGAAQSAINSKPVAAFSPPSSEILRFRSNPSLAFHSTEIQHIERVDVNRSHDQWRMQLNLMGLFGSMGVLPYHYTELILQRQKLKDETLLHFLDLFNHRTLSLFYQASVKYNLPLQYERKRLLSSQKSTVNTHTQSLLSLIGLGTEGLSNRLYTQDESLLHFSGLWTQKVRNVGNLKQLLSSHFAIPVEIEQFVGQWEELIEDVRTRLPEQTSPSGCNACLGRSAMLGKKGWFAQGKIRIILGPLNSQQVKKFAPGTRALQALNELVSLYLGMEVDYEFLIRLHPQDRPDKTRLSKQAPPIIGWNSWLSSKVDNSKDNLKGNIDISISARRLN